MKSGILIGYFNHKINEGAILRTAEAFGINNVFVIGKKKDSYMCSQGADRHLNYFEFENISDFIDFSYKNNYSLVCLENLNNSKEINTIKKYPANPIFITGNEKTGVPDTLLEYAKLIIKIEQAPGYVKCLNTATACGIVMHDFYKKLKNNRSSLWNKLNDNK